MERLTDLGVRTTGTGSVVGTFLGLALVLAGDAALTTAGVVLVILGAVSFLLTLGLYFDESSDDLGTPRVSKGPGG
ncbi:hypothetical protein BRD00_02680 [Halobacteriales archaeon QS_8_69_26]|nr:MAG: hypothetical protein BRD00_02680 [Halobacteriales archaeon QS_8_69_26]